MEEIEVWTVDGSQVTRLAKSSQMESELLLEDVLVENPSLLLEDLILVGRQTPTEGGPLDLLGVDGDGRLVVFELKRGTLSREAIAQVIDYASYLDGMSMDELSDHISQHSGHYGIGEIGDFHEWYSQRFSELDSLKPFRMFLVGLGVDERTERMVRFLAENSGMDISLLTFHGFEYDGRTILAKQVEVEGFEEVHDSSTRPRLSTSEKWALLNDRARGFGVHDLFTDVIELFEDGWPLSLKATGTESLSFNLPEYTSSGIRRYAYARIDSWSGRVDTIFYPRAVELCRDEFKRLADEIPAGRWSRNPDSGGYVEARFSMTMGEWETHKEKLATLLRAVYEVWENQDADGESGPR